MLDAFFESYTCPTDVIIYKVSMVFLISNIDVSQELKTIPILLV